MTQEKTYVCGEAEVRMTGRKASRPLPGGKVQEMVEITPVNEYDGTWKKFVNPKTLLEITEE